jgi:hypothetical protein
MDSTGPGAATGQPKAAASPAPPLRLPDSFISVSVISSVLLFSVLLIKIYGVAHYNVNIIVALASTSRRPCYSGRSGSTAMFLRP